MTIGNNSQHAYSIVTTAPMSCQTSLPFLAELGFNAFFSLELVLRAIASGGPRAYLRNGWNIFDLCMVLAGYTEFLPASWFGKSL